MVSWIAQANGNLNVVSRNGGSLLNVRSAHLCERAAADVGAVELLEPQPADVAHADEHAGVQGDVPPAQGLSRTYLSAILLVRS